MRAQPVRVTFARRVRRGRDMALRQPSSSPVGTCCAYSQLLAQAKKTGSSSAGIPEKNCPA